MTSFIIDISDQIYGTSSIRNIKVIFIESWTAENLIKALGKRYYRHPMRDIVDAVYSMDGPALTMNHADGIPVIVFDKNKMSMGDIAYQVNIIFDYIAESAGDVKTLTNKIYDLYLKLIEEEITESNNHD